MPQLSDAKKERYCNEYHIDCNRVNAVLRTGCWPELDSENPTPDDRQRASTIASRLHADPLIITRIRELERARGHRAQIYATKYLMKLDAIVDAMEPTEKPTYKDVISAADKLLRHLGEYAEDNKQKDAAAEEMFRRIMGKEDVLPSQAKDCTDESRPAREGDRAET